MFAIQIPAVTLIRKTLHSDIHQCPECGVPCSVARSAIEAAHHAQQSATVACHKCDAVFQPLGHDESTLDMPADNAATDTEQAQAGTRMRYGTCPKCRGNFLMPAMQVADDLLVECPHCSMKMPPCLASSICTMRAFCIGTYPPSAASTPVGNSSSEAIE